MAYVTQGNEPRSRGAVASVASAIWSGLQSVGKFLTVAGAAQARVQKMEELAAKSDEELAHMGIRREDIARVVFSDILYI